MNTTDGVTSRSGARFVLVTDSSEPSGVGEHMLQLAAGLRPHGRVNILFAAEGGAAAFADRAEANGLQSYRPDLHNLRSGGDQLASWLAAEQPDVIHVHAGAPWEGYGLVRCAVKNGSVVVRTEHLPWIIVNPAERDAYLEQVRLVDRVICVSEAARHSFAASGVNGDVMRVVRNGIEPRLAGRMRAEVRAELGIGPGRTVAITVARMTPQKGHRLIIDAVPSVLRRCPDVLFVWVGTGPLAEDLEREVAARGLTDYIRILGQRGDVPDLLAASDVFVLPSAFEGLPIAVLEASAAGLSIAGTRAPGLAEAVEHGVTGLLVAPDDAAGLATAIVVLCGDAGASMGQAARTRTAAQFTRARMAEETLGVYREALAEPRFKPSVSQAGLNPQVSRCW